jgi:hypothetical protein
MSAFGYSAKHPDYIGPIEETRKPSYLHKLIFAPRAQFIGVLNWLCPCCGKISRAKLMPKLGWHLSCHGSGCDAQFALGFTLWQMARGFKRPIDAGLPDPC